MKGTGKHFKQWAHLASSATSSAARGTRSNRRSDKSPQHHRHGHDRHGKNTQQQGTKHNSQMGKNIKGNHHGKPRQIKCSRSRSPRSPRSKARSWYVTRDGRMAQLSRRPQSDQRDRHCPAGRSAASQEHRQPGPPAARSTGARNQRQEHRQPGSPAARSTANRPDRQSSQERRQQGRTEARHQRSHRPSQEHRHRDRSGHKSAFRQDKESQAPSKHSSPKGQRQRQCRSPSVKGKQRQSSARQQEATCSESSRSRTGQLRHLSSQASGHGKQYNFATSSVSSKSSKRDHASQAPPHRPKRMGTGQERANPLTKDVRPKTWLAKVLCAETQQEALEAVREQLQTTCTEEAVEVPTSSGQEPRYKRSTASPQPKSKGRVTTTTTHIKMKVKKSPAKLQRDRVRLLKRKLSYAVAQAQLGKTQRSQGKARLSRRRSMNAETPALSYKAAEPTAVVASTSSSSSTTSESLF